MANPRSENHTQPPVKALDSKLNSEHAAYVLRGILQGIVADSELGHQEISILNAWLQSQRDFENDDARELLNLIGDVLADGTVTTDELQHIYILIDDIIEYGDRPEDEFDGLMHELLGLSQGMVSDGRITEGEFLSLTKWMIDNEHIVRAGPAYEIVARINEICEEGVVDQSELDKLLEVLKELSRQCQ